MTELLILLYFAEMLIAGTAIAITGKFFATLAYNVVYAVTAELFPTVARSEKIFFDCLLTVELNVT